MRRWRFLNRFFYACESREAERCVLVCEELEGREVLAPLIFFADGTIPQLIESGTFIFGSNGYYNPGQFGTLNPAVVEFVEDTLDVGLPYIVTLTTTIGTFNVNQPPASTVTGNGTASITLSGILSDIDDDLASRISLTPPTYYSGDAAVTLTATNPSSGETANETAFIQVLPVASNVIFDVNSSGEVFAPSSGFKFPPGFFSFTQWPDNDGSETIAVSFSLDSSNGIPEGFTLSANGTFLQEIEPGFWQLSANTPAALFAKLNSLVLTPPAGFTGRVQLFINANINDAASYPASDETTASDSLFLGTAFVPLRFFQGPNVTLPPVFGQEGGTIDLGGRFTASDPDLLPGDSNTMIISVASGTLTLNAAAVPAGLSATRTVAADGSTTIVLTGSIDAINAFLATSGCMTYTAASPTFAGIVPLSVVLRNNPGEYVPDEGEMYPALLAVKAAAATSDPPGTFTGVVSIAIVPVASNITPTATNVVTNQNTSVALSITLSQFVDLDGSESVLIILQGVPAGATFNRGTNLGNGRWAFSASDLPGLTFTPPNGVTGTFTITVMVIVNDSPAGVVGDSATNSTTFTITVQPLPQPANNNLLLPPLEDDVEVGTFTFTDSTSLQEIVDNTDFDDEDPDGRNDVREPANTIFAGYTGGVVIDPPMLGSGGRASYGSPALGSLFAQTEMPLPSYGGGEKHPLPPVLPLDQSLPVAGFSESGGDSFALIDSILRGASGETPATATLLTSPIIDIDTANQADALTTPEEARQAIAAVAAVTNDTGSGAAPIAEVNESEWRTLAAAGVVVGALAASLWLSRGSDGLLPRAVRKLLRAIYRRQRPIGAATAQSGAPGFAGDRSRVSIEGAT